MVRSVNLRCTVDGSSEILPSEESCGCVMDFKIVKVCGDWMDEHELYEGTIDTVSILSFIFF